MSTNSISKPWGYDVTMEKCVGYIGNDIWFTARSTNGDSSDSLHVYLPTDRDSLVLIQAAVTQLLNK